MKFKGRLGTLDALERKGTFIERTGDWTVTVTRQIRYLHCSVGNYSGIFLFLVSLNWEFKPIPVINSR